MANESDIDRQRYYTLVYIAFPEKIDRRPLKSKFVSAKYYPSRAVL